MPFKDKEARNKWHNDYYHSVVKASGRHNQWSSNFDKTPRGRFKEAKKGAKRRGIEWSLTFEERWKIWQDSGHWEERGIKGYHMCRKLDCGGYNIDNVYIAHSSQNASENLKYRNLSQTIFSVCDCCKEKLIAYYRTVNI